MTQSCIVKIMNLLFFEEREKAMQLYDMVFDRIGEGNGATRISRIGANSWGNSWLTTKYTNHTKGGEIQPRMDTDREKQKFGRQTAEILKANTDILKR